VSEAGHNRYRVKHGQELLLKPSFPYFFNKTDRVIKPAIKGITINTTTDVISTLEGTMTSATPRRNITIGATQKA
jgi:hypothetical protein